MLEVRDITKDYEGKPLLRGVSFNVQQHELLCLLGASGSGKSTLLHIIAGLETPESGSIWWQGKDITQLPPHKRGFGLMFQDFALFPHRTVEQNIAFGLRMHHKSKAEIQQVVKDSLATIRMQGFAKRRVTELSGGEQQRVALARALAPDPHLLLLDEPLGALDHALRVSLISELRQALHASGKPVIYVTHDRDEAFALADRLIILRDGLILQSGEPKALFDHPADAWTAEFLGLGTLVSGEVAQEEPLVVKTPLGAAHATAGDTNFPQNTACALLFRPQDAILQPTPAEAANTWEMRVDDVVFLGDYYRLQVSAAGQSLELHTQEPHPIGETVSVHFPAESLLCLKV